MNPVKGTHFAGVSQEFKHNHKGYKSSNVMKTATLD